MTSARSAMRYAAEGFGELLVALAFIWGTFAPHAGSVGWRLACAGIAILFALGAQQSFERWLRPGKTRTVSDSGRRVLYGVRLAAHAMAWISIITSAILRFLIESGPARDFATDLFILFAVFEFGAYYVRELAGQ